MWVVSKIIGDGLSPETAYRTAAQQYGLRILNADHIPVDPKTGRPASAFALIEIADADAAHLKADAGCFVIDKIDAQTAAKLQAQSCPVDVSAISTPAELVALVQAKVVADKQ